jgi:hypothetical protein
VATSSIFGERKDEREIEYIDLPFYRRQQDKVMCERRRKPIESPSMTGCGGGIAVSGGA